MKLWVGTRFWGEGWKLSSAFHRQLWPQNAWEAQGQVLLNLRSQGSCTVSLTPRPVWPGDHMRYLYRFPVLPQSNKMRISRQMAWGSVFYQLALWCKARSHIFKLHDFYEPITIVKACDTPCWRLQENGASQGLPTHCSLCLIRWCYQIIKLWSSFVQFSCPGNGITVKILILIHDALFISLKVN